MISLNHVHKHGRGHKLKRIRQDVGWTVVELSEQSGISVSTILGIENGTSRFKTNNGVASRLARALECHVSDIFDANELSDLGRPACTGGSYTVTTTTTVVVSYTACPLHPGIVLPLSGECDMCQ